jgi:hypothetical protein
MRSCRRRGRRHRTPAQRSIAYGFWQMGLYRGSGAHNLPLRFGSESACVYSPVQVSSYSEAAVVLSELIKHGLRTICFVLVRSVAELVLKRCALHDSRDDELPAGIHAAPDDQMLNAAAS